MLPVCGSASFQVLSNRLDKSTRGVARASCLRERAQLPYTSARSIRMEACTTPFRVSELGGTCSVSSLSVLFPAGPRCRSCSIAAAMHKGGVARASRLRERAHPPKNAARSIGMEACTTPLRVFELGGTCSVSSLSVVFPAGPRRSGLSAPHRRRQAQRRCGACFPSTGARPSS